MPHASPWLRKPWMLRGSLIELRRRCGKTGCHCLEGEPHRTPALSYSDKGRTRILTFSLREVAAVRAGLKRYQQALHALERQAMLGIEGLKRQLQRQRAAVRRKQS